MTTTGQAERAERAPRASSCPACRAVRSRVLFRAGDADVRRCASCGLRYCDPRPTTAELARVYDAGYLDGRGWRGDPERDSPWLVTSWREIRPELAARFPHGGRLLDVGCATGALLVAAAADGWEVVGLEVSAAAAERARANSLDVRVGTLGSGVLDGERFDVVTAWHVIEHVVAPGEDLARLRSLLAPGGLLVLETPNARSIGARLRGPGWAQIRPPVHINFFDRRSLTRALRESSFRPLWARTIYSRDSAARIARSYAGALVPLASAAARAAEAFGMGGFLRVMAEAC